MTTWIGPEDIMLSEIKSGRKRQILYDLTHVETKKQANKQAHRYREQTDGYQRQGIVGRQNG